MARDSQILEWGDKIYTFTHNQFDSNVDMDELTMIHYDNLIGEIITIPTLMNKIGILKAEADNAVSETKLSHRILEARKGEYYRALLTTVEKPKGPTVGQLEDKVSLDEEVSTSKLKYYKMEKQAAVIDALYWAVKSKEMKLNRISEGITPESFEKEITEGTINGILIKKVKKQF